MPLLSLADGLEFLRRHGAKEAWRQFRQTKHVRLGTLKGTDLRGNLYYENTTLNTPSQRWVIYADPSNYNASEIPSEWLRWMHHTSTKVPDEANYPHPHFVKDPQPNLTHTSGRYMPPGHFYRGKDTTKFNTGVQQWAEAPKTESK